jgi:hypothetical protein
MDTLGCAAGLAALLVHVACHPRILRLLSVASAERSLVSLSIALALAAFAVGAGLAGYHRDWPRWANGRAIVAVGCGCIVLLAGLGDLAGRL